MIVSQRQRSFPEWLKLAQIGVTGLAVMGRNLARNFARHGHRVAIHNRSYAKTESLLAEAGSEGTFIPSESMADFVASLERPRRVLIMVKAGPGTDAVIDELVPLLEEGDIVIDAGNAHFPDTIRRENRLKELGLHFVGTGVSGGEEGALNGPSIMPGGSRESYESLGPLLESISAKVDGEPCCTYVGPDGAGHFVKMVHNGIEYADMQLIAEAYDLIKQGTGASAAEIGEIFQTWNEGDLESFLIEITADVLGHTDAETGQAFVDVVLDQAEQKGTGRWTVQNALDLGVPITGIAEATFARALSGSVPQRKAGQARLAGHAGGVEHHRPRRLRRGRPAGAVRLEGRRLLPGLRPDRGRQRGVRLEHRPRRDGADLAGRLHHPGALPEPDHRGVRARAGSRRCCSPTTTSPMRSAPASRPGGGWSPGPPRTAFPTPAFSSSLAYYDGIRAERLPAALIQAQRDFFGAHTYHRVDKDGTFHTEWTGDRTETDDRCGLRPRRDGAEGGREGRLAAAVTRLSEVIGAGRAARAGRRAAAAQPAARRPASPIGRARTAWCPTTGSRCSSRPARRTSTSSSSGGGRWSGWPSDRPVFVIVDRPDTGDRVLATQLASRWRSPRAARRWRSWSPSVTSGWCST